MSCSPAEKKNIPNEPFPTGSVRIQSWNRTSAITCRITPENTALLASTLSYITCDYLIEKRPPVSEHCIKESNKMATIIKPREYRRWYETVRVCVWFPRVAVKVVFHQDESQRRSARHFPLFVKGRMKARWRRISHPPVPPHVLRWPPVRGLSCVLTSHLEGKACESTWFTLDRWTHRSNISMGVFSFLPAIIVLPRLVVILCNLFYLNVCLSKWLHVFGGLQK